MVLQIRGKIASEGGFPPRRIPAPPLRTLFLVLLTIGATFAQANAQSTNPIVHEDETGELTISVMDISADDTDGIRVTNNQEGNVTITSGGTINVDSTNAPAFGILVKNTEVASSRYTTTVNVNHMFSNADDGAVDGKLRDIAALRIRTTGGVTVHSKGHIHTTGLFNYGIHVVQTNKDSNAGPIEIQVNDITTEGPGSFGVNAEIVSEGNRQIDVRVNGRIKTLGWGSHGVAIGGNNANADVLVNPTGQVVATPPTGSWMEYYSDDPGQKFAVTIRKSPPGKSIASALLTNQGLIRGDIDIGSCLAPRFDNSGTIQPVRNP